jgi:hypothetical protein
MRAGLAKRETEPSSGEMYSPVPNALTTSSPTAPHVNCRPVIGPGGGAATVPIERAHGRGALHRRRPEGVPGAVIPRRRHKDRRGMVLPQRRLEDPQRQRNGAVARLEATRHQDDVGPVREVNRDLTSQSDLVRETLNESAADVDAGR